MDNNALDQLVERFVKEAETIGLYMRDLAIATPDPDVAAKTGMEKEKMIDAIKEGDAFMLMATFIVGDLAWTDRVLYPERFKEEQEFKVAAPDLIEIERQRMIDDIIAGRDPFAPDDENDVEPE